MTLGTASVVGIAVVCGFGVASIGGTTGIGCSGCAGLVGAGYGAKT